jgi:transposase
MGQTGVARARARTRKQLNRQEHVFTLNVIDGLSVRAIAKQLGVDRKTIQSDLAHEARRRADEIEQRRDTEQATHLAKLDHVFQRGLELATKPGAGGLAAAAKSLELRARVLGLEKAPKADPATDALIAAMNGRSPD